MILSISSSVLLLDHKHTFDMLFYALKGDVTEDFLMQGGGVFLRNHLMNRADFLDLSFYGYEHLMVSKSPPYPHPLAPPASKTPEKQT